LEWLGYMREQIEGLTDEKFAEELINRGPQGVLPKGAKEMIGVPQMVLPKGDGAVEAVLRQLPKAKRAWAKYKKWLEEMGRGSGSEYVIRQSDLIKWLSSRK
jgi:hypothetical protein